MVYRIYVEKKQGLANEALALKNDIFSLLQIKGLKNLRLLNRYDVERIAPELFEASKWTVFAEPQLDEIRETLPEGDFAAVFAVEMCIRDRPCSVGAALIAGKSSGIFKRMYIFCD